MSTFVIFFFLNFWMTDSLGIRVLRNTGFVENTSKFIYKYVQFCRARTMENCKHLFSRMLACTIKKKVTASRDISAAVDAFFNS